MEEDTIEWTSKLAVKSSHQTKSNVNISKVTASEDLNATLSKFDNIPVGQSEVLILEDVSVDKDQEDTFISPQRLETEKTEALLKMKDKMKRRFNAYDEEDELLTALSNKNASGLDEAPPSNSKGSDILLPKRRNMRKRLALFSDEPKPLETSKFVNDELPIKEALNLDDNDLSESLEKTRKEKIKLQLPDIKMDEDSNKIKGVAFSTVEDFLSIATKEDSKPQGREQDQEQGEKQRLPIQAIGDLNDEKALDNVVLSEVKDIPFEKEPLVRRGVVATLQFLSKLGVRPQLSTESEPPKQRKPESRFKDIKIVHYDEEGRELTAKEAYKMLSHKFHGKAPGKKKKEKLSRKIAEKQRIQSASLADTPLGMASAQREKLKESGSTHILLSQGRHATDQLQNPPKPKTLPPKKPSEPVRKFKIFGMQ